MFARNCYRMLVIEVISFMYKFPDEIASSFNTNLSSYRAGLMAPPIGCISNVEPFTSHERFTSRGRYAIQAWQSSCFATTVWIIHSNHSCTQSTSVMWCYYRTSIKLRATSQLYSVSSWRFSLSLLLWSSTIRCFAVSKYIYAWNTPVLCYGTWSIDGAQGRMEGGTCPLRNSHADFFSKQVQNLWHSIEFSACFFLGGGF